MALGLGCTPSPPDAELFHEACNAARRADEAFEAAHPREFVIRATTCEAMLRYVAKQDAELARRGARCLRTFTADDVARTIRGEPGRCPDEATRLRLNAMAKEYVLERRGGKTSG